MIDYAIGNEETRKKVERLVVEEKVDLDHQPIVVWIKRVGGKKEGEGRRKKMGENRTRWRTEEGREEFKKGFGERGDIEEGSVEEEWQSLKKKVTEAIGKMGRKEEAGKWKGWWDEEYRREKKRLEEELRRWRRMSGGDGPDRYREKKESLKNCVRRRREKEGKDGKER